MSGLDCDRWERRGQWLSRLGRTKLYWHCWLLVEIPQLGGRRKCAHQRTGVARFTVNAWPMGFFQQNTLFPDMEKTNAMQVDWTSPQQKPPKKRTKMFEDSIDSMFSIVPHCSWNFQLSNFSIDILWLPLTAEPTTQTNRTPMAMTTEWFTPVPPSAAIK